MPVRRSGFSRLSGGRMLGPALAAVIAAAPAVASGPAFTRLFAVADSAETAFMNPAGMTELEGTNLVTHLILGKGFSKFEVDEDQTTTTGGNPRKSDAVAVPALYYSRPLWGDLRMGATLGAPSGFGTSDGPRWAGRYYSDSYDLIFFQSDLTVAYPITDWLSVGGGMSIIYASSESTTQVKNPGAGDPDAKLEGDASGFGFGGIAAVLIQITPHTRLGVTWHSETEPDDSLSLKLKHSTLPPAVVDAINAQGNNVNVKMRTPQYVGMGLLQEWDNGWSATVDAVWVDFSRFGLKEIGLDGENISVPEGDFENFWVVSAGVSFPLTDRLEGRVGAMYMEQPVSNADRTISFQLDEMYGGGVGVRYRRANGHVFDANFSVFDTGRAPVDTGPLSAFGPRGRVVGEDNSPYAVALEFIYRWK